MRTPNLARQPFANHRPLLVVGLALAALALIATAVSVLDLLAARRAERDFAARLAPLEQRRAELARAVGALDSELRGVAWGKLTAEASALDRVLIKRKLVWTELLGNLERVLPWDVRLITINPSVDQEGGLALGLVGVSTGREGWLSLIARLFVDRSFSDPVPLSEQAPGATNAIGYRFEVRAHYWPEDRS